MEHEFGGIIAFDIRVRVSECDLTNHCFSTSRANSFGSMICMYGLVHPHAIPI